MVLFDIPYAFLAGGLIGWRGRGLRLDLALIYGAFGVGVPALAFLERYPDWDWQYLLDATKLPAGAGAVFVLLVLLGAALGHRAGHRRPGLLIAAGALLLLHQALSFPRAIHVGTLASWKAGGGFLMPGHFLLFSTLLMGASLLLFIGCWHLAGLASPFRLTPRERRVVAACARAALPGGPEVDPVDLTAKVERLVDRFAPEGQSAFRLTLTAFEWLALPRRGLPFSLLSAARQQRHLAAWADSGRASFRLAARLMLTVVKPCLVSRSEVQTWMGYLVDRLDHLQRQPAPDYPAERVIQLLDHDREVRCQVAVIGSGAGGAVVAAELAQRGVDVVLLEEGQLFCPPRMPRSALFNLAQMYRDAGTTIALGRPAIPIPLGATVGGTTTVNSGTCFRVPERVLDKWDALGLGIGRDELAACYERVEQLISVQDVPEELVGGSSAVIRRGADALGLSHRPLRRNIKGCTNAAVCAFGCPTDAKQSMNVTYVPAALEAGATLFTGVRAERLLTSGGKATGVRATAVGGGATLTVRADRVVSACGAISGVPFLAGCGVRSRHLGRHLTVHPATKVAALMPEVVDGWQDTPQGYCIDAHAEEGLMFEGAFVPPEYASISFPFVGQALADVMGAFRRLAMFGFMVADEPSGRVRRGLGGRPLVTYRISDGDLEKVRRGLRILSEVFFAAGAERIYLPLAGVEVQPDLDSALAALEQPISPWGLELTAFHPLGTARMSSGRREGVVGPDLQSWEIPGLYVIDGGIFPTSLGVNPQLTIMAMATRAAERLANGD